MRGPADLPAPSSKLHLFWTRPVDDQPLAGRLRVSIAVRTALQSSDPHLKQTVLPSLLSRPTISRAIGVVFAYLASLLRGRPLPIQCAIYAARHDVSSACSTIAPDIRAVYLDGVRTYALVRRIRRERPDLRIVVDLDDLMSRRMELLLAIGEELSPGYLSDRIPGFVQRLLRSPLLMRMLLRYERAALVRLENDLLRIADATVLLSSEDTAALRVRANRPNVITIPPPVTRERDPIPLSEGPLRFVFIGTDTLTQNRLTIDYLIDLWRRYSISTPLAIYGLQTRHVHLPDNVTMPGYAPSIHDIYDGSSILLSPSFLRGGIKTKVLEAFAFGTPVVANQVTFEAMNVGTYPLLIDDELELLRLIAEPEAWRTHFTAAAVAGAAYIRNNHDPESFRRTWCATLGLQSGE